MPRIPYSPVGRTSTPDIPFEPVRINNVSPAAFGAAIGEGIGDFGKALQVREEYKRQDQRFQALGQMSDWSTGLQESLVDQRRQSPLDDGNYYDRVNEVIANSERKFVASLPPELQQEFQTRTKEQANAMRRKEYEFDMTKRDEHYRVGIQDETKLQKTGVYEDPDSIEQRRKDLITRINSSGLSEAEKAGLIRSTNEELEKAGYYSTYKKLKQGPLQTKDMNGAYGYYVGIGVKPMIAAAILGNLAQESGGLNPTIVSGGLRGDNGSAHGAAQWRNERFVALKKYADANGKPWTDLKTQLDFVLHEMQFGDDTGARQAWKEMQSAQTVEEATTIFMKRYERPSNDPKLHRLDKRVAAARQLASGDQYASIEDDPRFLNVSYEDRIAIQRDVDSSIAQDNAAADKLAKEQRNSVLSDLYTGLGIDGNLGQKDVEDLRSKIDMTYDELNRAYSILDERNKKIQYTNRGNAKLKDSEATWDPYSTDDKKSADAVFGDTTALSNKDPNAAQRMVDFTQQANMPPPEALSTLNAMSYSQDWSQQRYALDVLSQVDQAAPDATAVFMNEDEVKRLETYRRARTLYSDEELQKRMRGPQTATERQEYQAGVEEAKGILKEYYSDPDVISSNIRSWWGGEAASLRPQAAKGLARDFETLFTDYYAKLGNRKDAEEATVSHLKRYWGRTDADGHGTFMKYPPEKMGYQPVNGSFDWINQQVREELKLPEDAKFELIPHENTLSRVNEGKPASYYVSVQQPSGEWASDGQKYYFEVTPDMVDKNVGEVVKQRDDAVAAEAVRKYEDAQIYSSRTGIPVPDDIKTEGEAARKALGWQDSGKPTAPGAAGRVERRPSKPEVPTTVPDTGDPLTKIEENLGRKKTVPGAAGRKQRRNNR